MDFTLYWFMFPVAILISTVAMLSGIAGSAIFMPFFLLIFPILGADYPLESPITAIAAALITSTFGFTSGTIGYYKKQLIDFKLAKSFLFISIPLAIAGSMVANWFNPIYLRFAYGCLMLTLVGFLLYGDVLFSKLLTSLQKEDFESRTQISSTGQVYQYALFKEYV